MSLNMNRDLWGMKTLADIILKVDVGGGFNRIGDLFTVEG
jgi:hypothetical protein